MTIVGLVLVGLFAGSLSVSLGIGGGVVYVPALVTLFSLAQHEAQGTSLAVIALAAIWSSFLHSRAGRVEWRVAILLGLGGVLGGILGARLALALEADVLRKMFAVFLVLMAVRMLVRTSRTDSGS